MNELAGRIRDLDPNANGDKLQPYLDDIADAVSALEARLAEADALVRLDPDDQYDTLIARDRYLARYPEPLE